MKRFVRAALALLFLSSGSFFSGGGLAFAGSSSIDAGLAKMDPATRLVQVCDLAVMAKMSSRKDGITEHAMIDALKPPQLSGNSAAGDGGAFRRRNQWFQFSYTCVTTPDRMQTTRLDVQIKRTIPRSEWASKNLFP